MPKKCGKRKPNKGLLKRIKFTSTGKAKKKGSGSGHLMSHKSGKKKRHLREKGLVEGGHLKRMRRMAGLA